MYRNQLEICWHGEREREIELDMIRAMEKERALSVGEENAMPPDWGGCISYQSGKHYHSCLLPWVP